MAAAGDISTEDLKELEAHLEECASCEKAFTDMKDIHAVWLPEHSGFEIQRSFAAESRLRQLILQQAAAEGARFSEDAQLPRMAASHSSRPVYWRFLHPALAFAAVLVVAVVGLGTVGRKSFLRWASPSSPAVSGAGTERSTNFDAQASQLRVLREKEGQMQAAQEKLEATLKKAQADRERLAQQLQEAHQRVSILGEQGAAATEQVADLQSQLDLARANQSKVEGQLAAFKASTSDAQTQLALVEAENKDLRDKLDTQSAGVDRERELMADGREIRDLIAARNLHIIDVYDTSGEGQTQKSFGRVFYTEGKSLVFYAYDLPSRRPAAKYAFYAWGKRDGSGDVKVRNLGIFYNDDQTQKRWVLKITNPQTLSEIDSVFVTLEKTDGFGNSPTGKKLLSAYLGSPANHP